MAEQTHTRINAKRNGNKNPDKIDRNKEPGIANVCKLRIIKEIMCTINFILYLYILTNIRIYLYLKFSNVLVLAIKGYNT